MRWVPWVVVALCAAFGAWILREKSENRFIASVDQSFEDWLIAQNFLPDHPPISVTLVEMEDPENWSALEYSLFLKALPKENVPVVVLETLPRDNKTAYDRAFRVLAIQEPRLILPVTLTNSKKSGDLWWLDGWKRDRKKTDVPTFSGLETGPPEALRGTTTVGVANLTEAANGFVRAPAYVVVGKYDVPSLALRAAMVSGKIPSSQVSTRSGFTLRRQRLPVEKDGTFAVDLTLLPGIRRVQSSDLLLRLEPQASTAGPVAAPLRGVIVLGDPSEGQRRYTTASGQKLSRAEILAASIATLCNGPVSLVPERRPLLILLFGAAFLPLLFAKARPWLKGSVFFLLIAAYLGLAIFLAARSGVVLPVFMPLAVFILGFGLNHLAASLKPHENARPPATAD